MKTATYMGVVEVFDAIAIVKTGELWELTPRWRFGGSGRGSTTAHVLIRGGIVHAAVYSNADLTWRINPKHHMRGKHFDHSTANWIPFADATEALAELGYEVDPIRLAVLAEIEKERT